MTVAGVVLLAATNRADVLDAALMRPGRFDVQLHVPLPDTASRQAILEVHTRAMPLHSTVDLKVPSSLLCNLRNAIVSYPCVSKHLLCLADAVLELQHIT
jgi:ATP-dependent Zn protease